MGRPPHSVPSVLRWATLGLGVLAIVVVSGILRTDTAGRSDIAMFTSSTTWLIAAPIVIAAVYAIATWNRFRGDRVLAGWLVGFAGSIALYDLWAQIAAAMHAAGATSSVPFLIVVTLAQTGWLVVLMTAQACATVAAGRALGDDTGRGVRVFLGLTLGMGTVICVLVPNEYSLAEIPDMALLLPRAFVLDPGVQGAQSAIILAWMLSLLVAPIVFWVQAARSAGSRRAVLARIGVGALLPGLVVLLCGLLAVFAGTGWVDGADIELIALTVGFCIAAPLTAWWLTAVVRDVRAPGGRAWTALSRTTPFLLWAGYGFGVIQIAGPLLAGIRVGAAGAVLGTTAFIALTAVPFRYFVRWCVQRVDPRRALAAAVIGASRDRAIPTAELAQRALSEAMSEPDLRVLIARAGGGWLDASLEPRRGPATDALTVPVHDHTGREIALICYDSAFIDIVPLLAVVQPLVERAALEAEVRDHAERLVAEGQRADAAADDARRRIERDLHDGVQSRLISLGLSLSLAKDDMTDPTSRILLDETVTGLQDAVVALRDLAHGNLSVSLADRGLAAAVGDLVANMPIPIDVTISDVDMDPAVEATAYFVIAEAVANALKHASARSVAISVLPASGAVAVRVSDDGMGGADVRLGSGLRGLTERVHAVGGRLIVSEAVPTGTVLEAVLPCAR